MTVSQNTGKLDTAYVYPRTAIKGVSIQRAVQFLNALYEGLLDSAAPDASAQVYRGHDHAAEGGGPIINGSQLTYDNYGEAVFEKTDFVAGDSPHAWRVGKFYASPGLARSDGGTTTQIAVYIEAVGSSFRVWAGDGPRQTVEVTGEGVARWVILERPIVEDGTWQDLYIHLQPGDKQGDGAIECRIYSVNMAETYQSSQPLLGQRDVQTAVSAMTILRYYGEALADELCDDADSLHADIFKRIYSAANALLECTLDRAAPGATSQEIQGHDHDSAGQLGRAIAHGKVYSAGVDLDPDGGSPLELWTVNATTLNQWEYADAGIGTYRRTDSGSTPGGTATTVPMFWAYVSAGISSSGDPPSAAPYLEGWVYVGHDDPGAAYVELRISNLTTGAVSETISLTSSSDFNAWKYIRYIPCTGDVWNGFAVEVRNRNSTSGDRIYTRAIIISEAYEYDGNNGAYVTTSGARILGSPRSGIEKVAS